MSNGDVIENDKKDEETVEIVPNEKICLVKNLTLLNAITIIVGCIIGSGIFVSPKGVTVEVGSFGASVIVWILGGVFSLVGAYCYAELATMIPDSGADYAYFYEAFGGFFAFLRLWVESVMVRTCNCAIMALTFAGYITEPLFPTCDQPMIAVRFLAAMCILLLAFINCASVKVSTKIQNLFTFAKLTALVVIIITGIVMMGMGRVQNFEDPFEGSATDPSKYVIAFYSSLFAYAGWNYLNFIEEMKNPSRDLPPAIVISCVLCIFVYVLTIVSYFTLVSTPEMIEVQAVGALFASRIYGKFAWIIPAFVVLSTFGSINGTLFTSARLCYVAGRKGHLPSLLNMIQIDRKTPVPAVMFTAIISILYLTSTDIYQMITYVGFAQYLCIGISVFILIYFRRKHPNRTRPIKIWLGWPIMYCLVTAFLLIYTFVGKPFESGISIAIILAGIPVYIVGVAWKKPRSVEDKINRSFLVIQKLFRIVAESQGKEE